MDTTARTPTWIATALAIAIVAPAAMTALAAAPPALPTGALASVIIVSAPANTGTEVGAFSLTADETRALTAAGYDAAGNYLGDQVATWSVVAAGPACGSLAITTGTSTLLDATRTGTTACRVRASVGPLADETGTIVVTPGAPVDLTIRTTSIHGDIIPSGSLFLTGTTAPLFAAAKDADGNRFGIAAHWRVDGGCGAVSEPEAAQVLFEATTPAPDCRVRAATADAPAAAMPAADATSVAHLVAWTGTLEVQPAGELAFLRLRSQSGGGGVVVREHTMTADDDIMLCAAGYGRDFQYLGDLVDAAWTLDPETRGALSAATGACVIYTPAPAGTVAIEAASGDIDGSAQVTVLPGAPTRLRIVDPVARTAVTLGPLDGGSTRELRAAGIDQHDNDAGDHGAAEWTVVGGCGTLSTATGGAATLAVSRVPAQGCEVRVAAPGLTPAAAPFTVNAPDVRTLVLRDAPHGGGATIGDLTRATDQPITLHAAGYDVDGHYVGDQTVAWSATGAAGTLVGANPATSIVFDPRELGVATVSATGGSLTATTGDLTIVAGAMDQVRLETAADGTGTDILSHSLAPSDTLTLHAIARDTDSQFIGAVAVTWSLEGCLVPQDCSAEISQTTGTSTVITATRPGETRLLADDGAGHANHTGPISVTPLPIDRVEVRLAAGRDGAAIPSWAMTADDTVRLCARGFSDDADQGNVIVAWSVTPPDAGAFDAASARCVDFAAGREGTATVTATAGPGVASTFAITIEPGRVAGFALDPAPSALRAGVATSIVIRPVDADLNVVRAYAGRVRVTSSDPGAVLPADRQVTSAETASVQVTLNTAGAQTLRVLDVARENTPVPLSSTFAVRVDPGELHKFESTLPAQTAGAPFTLTLTAVDSASNVLVDYDVTRTLSSNCDLGPAAGPGAITLAFTDGVASAEVVTTRSAPAGCALIVVEEVGIAGPSVTVNAAPLHHFAIAAIADQTSNAQFTVGISARDEYENLRNLDTGAVGVVATPSPIANGVTSVNLVGGMATLTLRIDQASTTTSATGATEVLTLSRGDVSSQSDLFKVNPAAAHRYQIDVVEPTAKTAGVAFDVRISVLDEKGNVRWQGGPTPVLSTDSGATLSVVTQPAFSEGIATWSVRTTDKPGPRTIGANLAAPDGSRAFTLFAAEAERLTVAMTTHVAGAATDATIKAVDAFGNVNLSVATAGTLASTCTVASPMGFTFAAGAATVQVDHRQAGACELTATSGALTTAAALAVTVQPADPRSYRIDVPATAIAGAAIPVTITDLDQYGNPVTSGTKMRPASDRVLTLTAETGHDDTPATARAAAASAPTPAGAPFTLRFQNGVATMLVTLPRAAAQTIGLRETAANSAQNLAGTSPSIAVAPAAAMTIGILRADPATATRADILSSESVDGRADPFEVTANAHYTFYAASFDEFDNLIGPAVGYWTDRGTAGTQHSSNGEEEPSVTWRWTRVNAADQIDLTPDLDDPQAAYPGHGAALAIRVVAA